MLKNQMKAFENTIYSNNVLLLNNPVTFQDTRKVPGSRLTPPVKTKARGYFSGYVFRGDTRTPQVIFSQGFQLQWPLVTQEQIPRLTGAMGGITYDEGISTAISVKVASAYSQRGGNQPGYVYLINACAYAGFAILNPRAGFWAQLLPFLNDIYEVNFMHSIPNTSIVGVVWSSDNDLPYTHLWPHTLPGLRLAVNPDYEGGIEAARNTVALFNGTG